LHDNWAIEFVEGGPGLPEGRRLDSLTSWTDFADSMAHIFAGTARYRRTIERPTQAADDWLLQLGSVYESARVTINDTYVGTLVAHPFELRIGSHLREGQNELVVEVTNLAANRIAYLDRSGVAWKNFHDINFVNINYKPFDASKWLPMPSGLLGPVTITPLKWVKPGA
jgi:hypothetical protein